MDEPDRPPDLPTDASRPPDRVAVVLLSAIGDVVHGMPVVTSLREAWPEARLDWVIEQRIHPLVAPHPDVDDFVLFDRSAGLSGFLDFRRRTRGRRYDLVVDLQVYLKAGVLTGLLDADVKLGFDRARARDLNWLFTTHRIPPHPVQHVEDQYFEFLAHLGVDPVVEWRFAFDEDERRARDDFFVRFDRPVLAVVLRTTREDKNWPAERYARVLEAAEDELGLAPVMVGSDAPPERAVADAILAETGAEPVDALATDLRRLAWILDGADLTLSPDTGPLHVSNAVGTPVVGLYGATDPKRAGPYRPEYRDLVVDAFTDPGETGAVHEYRSGRMERITVDRVVERLAEAVERFVR